MLRGTTLVSPPRPRPALLLAGCGSNDTELRSEGSHQRARPAGLGIERLHVVARPVSPTKSRRCVTAAFEPSGTQAYAAVVRRRVAVVHAWPSAGSPVRRQFARIDQNGFPTVLGVLGSHLRDCRPVWFKAQLPSRAQRQRGMGSRGRRVRLPGDEQRRRRYLQPPPVGVRPGPPGPADPGGDRHGRRRRRPSGASTSTSASGWTAPTGPSVSLRSASRRTRTCCRTGSRAARSRSTERTTRLRSAARPPTAVSGSRTPTCAACSGWRRRALPC